MTYETLYRVNPFTSSIFRVPTRLRVVPALKVFGLCLKRRTSMFSTITLKCTLPILKPYGTGIVSSRPLKILAHFSKQFYFRDITSGATFFCIPKRFHKCQMSKSSLSCLFFYPNPNRFRHRDKSNCLQP